MEMTKQHKWHKEIKAWADGAEIEEYMGGYVWLKRTSPEWAEDIEYRIKPQPKEPQYLYVYESKSADGVTDTGLDKEPKYPNDWKTIGKIKLEADDD